MSFEVSTRSLIPRLGELRVNDVRAVLRGCFDSAQHIDVLNQQFGHRPILGDSRRRNKSRSKAKHAAMPHRCFSKTTQDPKTPRPQDLKTPRPQDPKT